MAKKKRTGQIEVVALIYPLPCIKSIASEKLLYDTGSPARCAVMTSRGGMVGGKDTQEGGHIHIQIADFRASQMVLVVKNPLANAGDVRDAGSIPGLRRSPEGGHGNPLQYSCLENLTDGGAWQAISLRVTKSQTRLKQLSKHA